MAGGYLKDLHVENIKGFSKLEIEFEDDLTLIIGPNGVGKTTVLDCAAHVMSFAASALARSPKHELQASWVRLSEVEGKSTGTINIASISGEIGMSVTPKGVNNIFGASSLTLAKLSASKNASAKKFAPMTIFYNQTRTGNRHDRFQADRNRYTSLSAGLGSAGEFISWFDDKSADEGRRAIETGNAKNTDPELDAIRKFAKLDAGYESVEFQKTAPGANLQDKLFLKKGGNRIAFSQLSSGERVYFLLGADIARRLLVEFPGSDLADCPALVLIDEIELHLHPSWQRSIIPKLMETFQSCQFIVTSHSPAVVQSVEARHIRYLTVDNEGVANVETRNATKGRDANYILEGIFELDERSPEVAEKILRFERLLTEESFENAEILLAEIENDIEGASAKEAILRARLERMKAGAGAG